MISCILPMPINATRLIRKMRGGTQAHSMECDDANFYEVKFRNNPQHRRILVNELIASVFLNYLQIATPETAIVNVPARANQSVSLLEIGVHILCEPLRVTRFSVQLSSFGTFALVRRIVSPLQIPSVSGGW